jgi:F0F1-type ATP synthase epsilon subunit
LRRDFATSIDGKAQPSLFISGGFVDVSSGVITVMADVIEKASEIDRERVKKSQARADERLIGNKAMDIDVPRALRAKKRAGHRLELTGADTSAH